MKPKINITLVLLRVLSSLLLFCFFSGPLFAKFQYKYTGTLRAESNTIPFSIFFSIDKKHKIQGISITGKGSDIETKCRIKGKYNPKNKSIFFYETVVLSTKATFKNLNFCLLTGTLKRTENKKTILYSGQIKGFIRNTKTSCLSGTMKIQADKIKPKKVSSKSASPQKADTLISHIAGKKILDYKWKNESTTLEIWDNIKADGDRIDIYLDGKKIIPNYELKESKKSILLPLSKKHHIIKVVALNEGKASPNTSQIILKSGSNKKRIIAHIKKGERVYIKLTR